MLPFRSHRAWLGLGREAAGQGLEPRLPDSESEGWHRCVLSMALRQRGLLLEPLLRPSWAAPPATCTRPRSYERIVSCSSCRMPPPSLGVLFGRLSDLSYAGCLVVRVPLVSGR